MWKRVLPPSAPAWDRKGVKQFWKETKPGVRWCRKGTRIWKALGRMYENYLYEKQENRRLAEERAAWILKVKRRMADNKKKRRLRRQKKRKRKNQRASCGFVGEWFEGRDSTTEHVGSVSTLAAGSVSTLAP